MEMLKQLSLAGLVPVIRVENANDAVPLCAALRDGGLPVAEITFRSDAAAEAIRRVHDALPDVLLGAGTVLAREQVDAALQAGAAYIVSPGLNRNIVRYCQDKGVPVVPGCANASDIEAALEEGLDTVKFFPAEVLGGVKMLRALSAPYGGIRFLPTGGVNENNLNDYLALPQVVACGGSWMVPGDAVAAGDWARVTRLTRSAVALMLGLEVKHVGINTENEAEARRVAGLLSVMLDWPTSETAAAVWVKDGFEVMKAPFKGKMGHVAIGCNNIFRARWHLEKRGFAFDDDSVIMQNGRVKALYMKDEIAGFSFHLAQK